ncbi:MAG: sugar-transfer associated ATP-grasp domain-containing protein [Rubrobacter sp.]
MTLNFGMDRWSSVLGMNRRNALVDMENPPEAVRLVNNKHETKVTLAKAGVPVPTTIALLRGRGDLSRFGWDALPESWALKPNLGRRGAGIVLATGRDREGWRTASGHPLSRADVSDHLRRVLDGEFSLEGAERDLALFEPLISTHEDLARLVPHGLPDVRVICHGDEPVLAMMRLPTLASDGRANLHQGAIGAAVDLRSGRLTAAVHGRSRIDHHPDTGERLLCAEIPHWQTIVEAASRCAAATGLGYLGADIVVDEARGPLVLEVNARPGLEIQNVTRTGLRTLVAASPTANVAVTLAG